MDIDFDPDKDAANQIKHGLSLSLAAHLDWEVALSGSMGDLNMANAG
jgi:uncharacterized DUF497 family protein